MEDDRRAEFEALLLSGPLGISSVERNGEGYSDPQTDRMWRVWKHARSERPPIAPRRIVKPRVGGALEAKQQASRDRALAVYRRVMGGEKRKDVAKDLGVSISRVEIRTAAQYVLDEFRKTEATGASNRDREFAISVLAKALEGGR